MSTPNVDKIKSVGYHNYDLGNDGFVKLPPALAKKYNLNPNEKYWLKVDKRTGNTQIWNEEWGFLSDRDLATMTPDGKIEPNDTLPGGFGASDDEIRMLNDPDAKQFFKNQAQTVVETKVKEELKEQNPDIYTDEVAQTEAEKISKGLLKTNEAIPGSTKEFNEEAEEDNVNSLTTDVDNAQMRDKYSDIKYPIDLNAEYQDFIQFQMIEYVPRQFSSKGEGTTLASRNSTGLQTLIGAPGDKGKRELLDGVGNAIKTGGGRGDYSNEQNGERKILATMTLPIPAGIGDQNGVDWGEQAVNQLDQAIAGLSGKITAGNLKGVGADVEGAVTSSGTPEAVRAGAVSAMLSGSAFTQREYGAVLNKNLELLFNGPRLRGFSFTFRMSPRNPEEAKAVRGIIRQFKQGMSPKKGKTFTFIKAPHTFFIGYYHKGSTSPWLNMFKECALESMNMNYTPDGQYSTFTDGAMTSYEMQLSFKELEPVFDSDYDEGTGGADNEFIGY